MAVTRVYDSVFGWIVVPVRRWNGSVWVADQRPKVRNTVTSTWVPMNGVAVRIVGFGDLSFDAILPAGAQVNINGTGTMVFDADVSTVDPCIADGLTMETGVLNLMMEDDSECLYMENA